MNILLTGGNGFLGRHIKKELYSKGYNVFSPGSIQMNLESGAGAIEMISRFISKNGSIDTLIHSAAYYGGIGINQTEPADIFFKNTKMALNVFNIARRHKIKKIIPIGSACSYPGYLKGNLKEENFWDGPLHDSVEAYGFSKKIQLVAQKAYFKQYGIESNHLILTNLYGPHDVYSEYRSHVVSALIKKFVDAHINETDVNLWGTGSPIREFLYVEDAAEAIVKSVTMEHDLNPINIGTGVGTSIKELAETISDIVGFSGKINWDSSKPDGCPKKVLDVSNMKEKLDFYPTYKLRDGLRKTIEWYVKNKSEADKRT